MAKPVASFVQLPDDSGNTGKKIRTQTRIVGANTVHEHFFVPSSQKTVEGVYFADLGAASSVQASAQNGTSTGFGWLFNAAGNTINTGLRRVKLEFSTAGTTVTATEPRIALALFTFTGTPSGTAVAIAKRATADAAAQASLRTASTGATVTLGNIASSSLPPQILTGVGALVPSDIEMIGEPSITTTDEDWDIVSATGEGAVLYQPDAGTASDPRRFLAHFAWEEFDNS